MAFDGGDDGGAHVHHAQHAGGGRQDRSTLILVFGILGLLVCQAFGIAAWVMGSADLKAMDQGQLDDTNRGTVNAGRILGIVSCCLLGLGILAFIAFMALGIFVAASGDMQVEPAPATR